MPMRPSGVWDGGRMAGQPRKPARGLCIGLYSGILGALEDSSVTALAGTGRARHGCATPEQMAVIRLRRWLLGEGALDDETMHQNTRKPLQRDM